MKSICSVSVLNLTRAFGAKNHDERKGDLSTANVEAWLGRDLRPEVHVAIRIPARKLDETYHREIFKTCNTAHACATTLAAAGMSISCLRRSDRSSLPLKQPSLGRADGPSTSALRLPYPTHQGPVPATRPAAHAVHPPACRNARRFHWSP